MLRAKNDAEEEDGPSVGPTLSKLPQKGTEELLLEHARLDKASFFAAMKTATGEDLETSRFAGVVFRKYAEDHDETKGVNLDSFQLALDHAGILVKAYERTTCAFDSEVEGVTVSSLKTLLIEMFVQMGLSNAFPSEFIAQVNNFFRDMESGDGSQVVEIFERWDTDGSGSIQKAECIVFGMSCLFMAEIFIAIGRGQPLNKENYGQALAVMGFADAAKLWRGVFANSMYTALDLSGDGSVDLPEFWTGCSRLLRPIEWEKSMKTIHGFPGWHTQSREEIGRKVASLQTGDIVLVQYLDTMARFIQFSTNSPYNHIGVVVRHAARPGIPNEHTEQFLTKYPRRRQTHQSCSPGYCRCFDQSWDTRFPLAKIDGQGISLLESTAEGIHVYDFAQRMFESTWAKDNISLVSVRRLSDVDGRDSFSKVERFIDQVRGHLFTSGNDDLRDALERTATSKGLDTSGAFCSQVVLAFYKHMGWLKESAPPLCMPCDFDDPAAPTFAKNGKPVEVTGKFGPVEVIFTKA